MRALRVLGLTDNGAQVVCEEPESGDQFALPTDERLNAAVRGDLSRLGQLEIEMQPQLRPREIQARVRAGASIEQIAAVAGCDPSKIERFAYPVLMERSAITEKARQAHPVIDGLPAELTVEQLVQRTLTSRGQAADINWDAYREETGQWVLLLRWTAGRSENTARWAYHPRSTGSTLVPHDEAAAEIVDPAPRPLRTVRDLAAVTEPVVADHPMLTKATPASDQPSSSGLDKSSTAGQRRHPAGSATSPAKPTAQPAPAPATTEAATPKPAKSKGRPAMPSWEDVLLGVRSSGH